MVISAGMTFLVALVAGLVLTPVARRAARHCGVVDHPDGHRKLHGKPVPLWGGVAVTMAMLAGMAATTFAWPFEPADDRLSLELAVAVATGLVCLIGVVDDSFDLSPRRKLVLQSLAALSVVALGYSVTRVSLFGFSIELGNYGSALTVVWLLACINAMNLLDGLDGLASLAGLIIAAAIAAVSLVAGHPQVALIGFALAGSLAAFLVFNRPPASIYLGDSGSLVIGMVVGILAWQGSLVDNGTLPIGIPLAIMTLPLLDTCLAVVRRRLNGRRFDAADRDHIHHRLLRRGLTPRQVLGLIALLMMLTGSGAVLATTLARASLAWSGSLLVVAFLFASRLFGSEELLLMRVAIAQAFSRAWLVNLRGDAKGAAPNPTESVPIRSKILPFHASVRAAQPETPTAAGDDREAA
ncbi:MAG: glycosyltransferase family 4 protein [Pirellulales bacterium]